MLIVLVAVINGGIRQGLITPWTGDSAGRAISTVMLAFEFLAGHYVFGTPWSELLADYNVFRGRIWVLVLITTATAPWLAAQGRGLLPRET